MGQYICANPHCSRVRTGWEENNSNFKIIGQGQHICKSCGMFGIRQHCGAKKLTEYSTSLEVLILFHQGQHTCNLKEVEIREQKEKRNDLVRNALITNMKAKPRDILLSQVTYFLSLGQEQEAEEAALLLSNTKEMSKIRCAHLKQIFSDDHHSMRAVKNAKEKLDKVDPFLLYSYKNENEDASKPTCIYKSSLESIKTALEMNTLDKKNFSPMREEFLFMDTMHKCLDTHKANSPLFFLQCDFFALDPFLSCDFCSVEKCCMCEWDY